MNFVSGATVTDDPVNRRTNITILTQPDLVVPGPATFQLGGQSGTVNTQANDVARTIFNLRTTSTSPQTLATIGVPTSSAVAIRAYITGRLSAAPFTPYYNEGADLVSNNSGTLSTNLADDNIVVLPGSGSAALSFTNSGTNVLVQIAAASSTSTDWMAVIDVFND
jgi:hypothetical protein